MLTLHTAKENTQMLYSDFVLAFVFFTFSLIVVRDRLQRRQSQNKEKPPASTHRVALKWAVLLFSFVEEVNEFIRFNLKTGLGVHF